MSSQKGNTARTRPQKYKNRTAFKNTLHDKSQKTKTINAIQVCHVCQRCKDIIEWKIKYKKYKPLTQPKKCVKCDNKNIKKAYHIMCDQCGHKLGVCVKCGEAKELFSAPVELIKSDFQLDPEMKDLMKILPERKRRTFLRFVEKNTSNSTEETETKLKLTREDFLEKLNALIADNNEDFEDDSNNEL